MSKTAAVLAYRDSLFDASTYDLERRIESRKLPLIGAMWPTLKTLGNAMWRPFKVGGALAAGYNGESVRPFPKMPAVPEVFQGSSLGTALAESWKLKEEAAKARVESFSKLLNVDISGWWQTASVASYAETKDNRVIVPEDGVAQDVLTYAGNRQSIPFSGGKGGSGVNGP